MTNIYWKGKAFKALTYGKTSQKAGRNFSGSITIFHRGGGAKKLLRRIDFRRNNLSLGLVERIEYDPNRTARIALVRWHEMIFSTSNSRTSLLGNSYSQKTAHYKFTSLRNAKIWKCSPQQNTIFSLYKKYLETQTRSDPTLSLLRCFTASHFFSFAPHHRKTKQEKNNNNLGAKRIIVQPNLKKFQSDAQQRRAFSYILACQNLNPGDEVFNIEAKTLQLQMNDLEAEKKNVNSSCFQNGSTNFFGQISSTNLTEQVYQKAGNSLPLFLAPLGCIIHNIELIPGKGGKLARAAGTYGQLVQKQIDSEKVPPIHFQANENISRCGAKDASLSPRLPSFAPRLSDFTSQEKHYFVEKTSVFRSAPRVLCTVRLPSGQQQLIDSQCQATIGTVSNGEHNGRNLRKAGQTRWLGFRPVVRGVAMNPIDHPHGGGEGRTKGGRPSVSPWGKPAKGSRASSAHSSRRSTKKQKR